MKQISFLRKKIMLLIVSTLFFCVAKAQTKPALNAKPVNSGAEKKKLLSASDAVQLAEKKFRQYLPKIEASQHGVLDLMEPHTGDFTGDGIEDIAIYFSLSSKDGGNALVSQGITLYQNTGSDVKVIGGFDPDYLFSFSRISDNKIYIEKLEYADDDPRCCPSIKQEKALTISGSTVY